MAVEVILPRVDMDMATGKISKWHHRDGDRVAKGAALFEIETDKAAMEIDSPADGILRNITVNEGGTAPVGSAVAWIYAEGEAVTTPAPAKAAAIAPVASNAAPAAAAPVASPSIANGETPRATPLARRLARQAGLPLAAIPGSGPRGRIVAADVRGAGEAKPAPAAAPAPSPDNVQKLYALGSFEVVPVDGMRRTIAARLTESKQTVPHFYLSVTCTLDTLLATRERLNASAPKGADGTPLWKLSINDFIIKAMAAALQKVPAANVTWAGDAILQHRGSDVGVAVAVEGGLFTPVIRAAEAKTLTAISAEMKELAARARARKLVPSEYQGGTTAISNLGMYGIEQFTAIINPPQATILAVGAAVERFVPVKGQPVLATQMTATLSCDHRAVDGAVGAELLQAFRSFMEEPLLMLA
ncbi:pyruvate dehydrogenase complex dihydrolipoamide acetyltransferase [Aestuariivirga litoralis]|uniref:Dihydrolipoamide acetyltransferase component of pyruvate dehydrogenase complex n=1 Tax=Aestuariivirga litoralis TaxID=2650924 RepID=A0A2W2B771_9HYPH|nr:dihydrolipoamide acetyltransferase family protein [Aestuariivirga litoralis]PZF76174.1 pyruvate dehydrogenase complex dihydrolipoamide acetyltransferase [Aestuariivirga litoralis]